MKHHWVLRASAALLAAGFALAASAADPLPRAAPAAVGFSAAGLARIDRFYADEIARDRIPGAIVAIARDGKLAYYKAFGYQDKATGMPLKSGAIFSLANVAGIDFARGGYGLRLRVAVHTKPGVAATNGTVGDFA